MIIIPRKTYIMGWNGNGKQLELNVFMLEPATVSSFGGKKWSRKEIESLIKNRGILGKREKRWIFII